MTSEDGYEPAADAGSAEARVQGGLTALDGLNSRPLAEHAPAYDALHEDLQAVLAEIDGA